MLLFCTVILVRVKHRHCPVIQNFKLSIKKVKHKSIGLENSERLFVTKRRVSINHAFSGTPSVSGRLYSS